MALPEFADQKREQEKQALKGFLSLTIAVSLALHVGLLLLNIKPLWRTIAPEEQEEIAIIVTESEEPEIEDPVEELPEEELLTADGGSSFAAAPVETVEATVLPEPIEPIPMPEVATAEPLPQPTEESVTEPEVEPSPTGAEPTTEAPQTTAVAPNPQRNIQDLLEQLRRNRSTRQQSESGTGSAPAAVSEPSAPAGTGTGSGPDNSSRGDQGNEPEAAPSRNTGEGRRIACRDCPEVNYPEEALRDRQEGTVKVLVDYDENGNVVGATLVDSSGHTVLDQAVLETVREKYRLRDTGGAGSTVLSVDMTIDGSEFNRQAEERGDRRAIDIPPPAPVADEPVPANTAVESVEPEPQSAPTTPATATSTPAPQPSEAPVESPSAPQEATAPLPANSTEPTPSDAPVAPVETSPAPIQEAIEPPPEPIYTEPAPEPAYTEPAYTEPEPIYEPEPAYVPPVEPAPVEAAPLPDPAATDAGNEG